MKRTLSCLFGILLFVLPAHTAVLPPNAIVGDRTIGEWTAECWKWVWSIPTNENPQLDCDGRWANNRQPYSNVFFIAPVIGLFPPPCERTFTVAEGKYILMPVVAITHDNIDIDPPLSVVQMCDNLEEALREASDLHASVDGVPVANLLQHRAKSPAFSLFFQDADNPLTINYGKPVVGLLDPVVVDGFWLMIEPLSPGSHTVRAGGSVLYFLPNEIIAHITVSPFPLEERVEELIRELRAFEPGSRTKHLLESTLRNAGSAFEKDNLRAGIQRLRAFQQQVRAQLLGSHRELAGRLISQAQQIIEGAMQQLPPRHHNGNDGDDGSDGD